MTNKIEKLSGLLPKLSKKSLSEVLKLVEDVVEERVNEEKKLLEAKVSGFLRTKIENLKETARAELEAEDTVLRGYRIFETIRALVAEEVESEDVDSVVSEQNQTIADLQEKVESLNEQISISLQENSLLCDQVEGLSEENTQLTESAKLPFKTSESAVVITNETDSRQVSHEAVNNIFLTEDVINLANPLERGE